MIWTAWNNGSHLRSGGGYGFKIEAADRDRHISRAWKTVLVDLPGPEQATVEVNIDKKSFWSSTCREIVSHVIGKWLIANGYAPWRCSTPPKFSVVETARRHFAVQSLTD